MAALRQPHAADPGGAAENGAGGPAAGRRVEEGLDLLALLGRDQRPEPSSRDVLRGRLGGELLRVLDPGCRDDQSGQRRTGLSSVEVTVPHSDLHGLREKCVVGVVENDARRLAAQLERDARQRLGRRRGDLASDRCGTGERDLVDARMPHEVVTDHAPTARHQVEHAGGQPCRIDGAGELERGERGESGRFQHDRRPCGQRRDHLHHDLVQRQVPRRDGGDDPDRLTQDDRVADLAAEGEAFERVDRRVDDRERRVDNLLRSIEGIVHQPPRHHEAHKGPRDLVQDLLVSSWPSWL